MVNANNSGNMGTGGMSGFVGRLAPVAQILGTDASTLGVTLFSQLVIHHYVATNDWTRAFTLAFQGLQAVQNVQLDQIQKIAA